MLPFVEIPKGGFFRNKYTQYDLWSSTDHWTLLKHLFMPHLEEKSGIILYKTLERDNVKDFLFPYLHCFILSEFNVHNYFLLRNPFGI